MARFFSLMLLGALTLFVCAKEATAAIQPFGYKNSVSLAASTSLQAGCTSCGRDRLPLHRYRCTLAADTTLNCNLVVAGGIIYLARTSLPQRLDLGRSRHADRQCRHDFEHNQLTITGGTVLYGAWFTGPYGNAGVNYLPRTSTGLQFRLQRYRVRRARASWTSRARAIARIARAYS